MSIKEMVEKMLADKEPEMAKHPSYKRLNEFYQEMQREGIVLKKEYDLPPLDTLGTGIYQEMIVHRFRRNT